MHPSRILFLEQYGEIGGGQRILLDLAAAAKKRGWIVSVLCPAGPLSAVLESLDCTVMTWSPPVLPDGKKSLLHYVRTWLWSRQEARRLQLVAQENDLIIVNGLRTMDVARRWNRGLHKPALLYLHGVYRGLQSWLIKRFLRSARTMAIAPSPIIAFPLAGRSNVHTILHWVSPLFLTTPEERMVLRTKLGIPPDAFIILVPGRFSLQKGQLIALDAFRHLNKPDAHIVFAGSPLFEKSGRMVEEKLQHAAAMNTHVHSLAWDRSLPALYDGSDLVIVPSVWAEPFGLVALEAMARNRPLIVSDRGMLPHIADFGKFATVTEPTQESLASSIQECVQSSSAWRRRTELARAMVLERFSPDRQQQSVFDAFSSLTDL